MRAVEVRSKPRSANSLSAVARIRSRAERSSPASGSLATPPPAGSDLVVDDEAVRHDQVVRRQVVHGGLAQAEQGLADPLAKNLQHVGHAALAVRGHTPQV